MEGKLALYSGAVFAGVLIAGTVAIRGADGTTNATSGSATAAAAADPAGGQPATHRSFLSRITSFVSNNDEDDGEEYEVDSEEDD